VLLKLLLLLLSVAHETPLSVACASLLMRPAPTAVEEASGESERPPLLLRLPLLLLSAAHATPLSAACASLPMLPAPTAVEEAEEASGALERPLLLARLLLKLPPLRLSASNATPLSVACVSLLMLPAPPPSQRRAGTSRGRFCWRGCC
jgi:hypothetical protein